MYLEKIGESTTRVIVSEAHLFFVKSGFFLIFAGAILYLLLFATYPPIHDALHDFRHSLAIIPCH